MYGSQADSDFPLSLSLLTGGVKIVDQTIPAVAASENFEGTWPFRPHYTDAPDFRMHFIDEGSGPETLLLLHGEPTWSYLFRHQIPVWAAQYRVIAVDHMGFGKSAAPENRTYWLQDHIDNLECFVTSKDLRNLTLVMHDFGGPTGMGLAIRQPDRIKRIVSINGPTPAGQPDLVERLTANVAVSPWFQWIMKANNDGVLEQVLGQLHYNILSTLKLNGFERNEIITNTWLEAYRAPFPTPKHAVGGIGWAKGYATGAHQFEQPDAEIKSALANKPALAIWGDADQTLHADHFLPLFNQAFPSGQVHRLPAVGHYSPEDASSLVAELVTEFVETSR
jgi:pimeloyl-ACP methyl ester carboxylesterase